MDNQVNLFQDEKDLYQVNYYFGRLIDTKGDDIYFVRTIKTGLTKFACFLINRQLEDLITVR